MTLRALRDDDTAAMEGSEIPSWVGEYPHEGRNDADSVSGSGSLSSGVKDIGPDDTIEQTEAPRHVRRTTGPRRRVQLKADSVRDALEQRYRREGNWDDLVDLYVGRIEVVDDAGEGRALQAPRRGTLARARRRDGGARRARGSPRHRSGRRRRGLPPRGHRDLARRRMDRPRRRGGAEDRAGHEQPGQGEARRADHPLGAWRHERRRDRGALPRGHAGLRPDAPARAPAAGDQVRGRRRVGRAARVARAGSLSLEQGRRSARHPRRARRAARGPAPQRAPRRGPLREGAAHRPSTRWRPWQASSASAGPPRATRASPRCSTGRSTPPRATRSASARCCASPSWSSSGSSGRARRCPSTSSRWSSTLTTIARSTAWSAAGTRSATGSGSPARSSAARRPRRRPRRRSKRSRASPRCASPSRRAWTWRSPRGGGCTSWTRRTCGRSRSSPASASARAT